MCGEISQEVDGALLMIFCVFILQRLTNQHVWFLQHNKLDILLFKLIDERQKGSLVVSLNGDNPQN